MVRPLVDNPDAGIRQVAAWWLARRAVSRQIQARHADPPRRSRTRSAARNAADVLGEFHYAVGDPGAGRGAVEPALLGRGARGDGEGARDHRTGRPSLAPLYGALGDSNAQVKTGALLGAAVDVRAPRRRGGRSAADRRRRGGARRGGDHARDVPGDGGDRGARERAARAIPRRPCASGRPGRSARSAPAAAVAGPALQTRRPAIRARSCARCASAALTRLSPQ